MGLGIASVPLPYATLHRNHVLLLCLAAACNCLHAFVDRSHTTLGARETPHYNPAIKLDRCVYVVGNTFTTVGAAVMRVPISFGAAFM